MLFNFDFLVVEFFKVSSVCLYLGLWGHVRHHDWHLHPIPTSLLCRNLMAPTPLPLPLGVGEHLLGRVRTSSQTLVVLVQVAVIPDCDDRGAMRAWLVEAYLSAYYRCLCAP